MSSVTGGDEEVGDLSPILDETLGRVIPKGASLRDMEVCDLRCKVPGFVTRPVAFRAVSIRLLSQGGGEALERGAGQATPVGGNESDR